jgi:hypothetical protein
MVLFVNRNIHSPSYNSTWIRQSEETSVCFRHLKRRLYVQENQYTPFIIRASCKCKQFFRNCKAIEDRTPALGCAVTGLVASFQHNNEPMFGSRKHLSSVPVVHLHLPFWSLTTSLVTKVEQNKSELSTKQRLVSSFPRKRESRNFK